MRVKLPAGIVIAGMDVVIVLPDESVKVSVWLGIDRSALDAALAPIVSICEFDSKLLFTALKELVDLFHTPAL